MTQPDFFFELAAMDRGFARRFLLVDELTQVVEVEKEVTKIVAGTPVVEKVVETQIVEKEVEVTRIVEVPKEAEVTGTFFVLQKKDFFPGFMLM